MDADRKGRDAAGVGPYAREREHLVPISTLASWTVAAGEPDIRGWEVRTVSGRQLGSVSDLLVDSTAGEVVMIDVDLPGTDRHAFVPIRVVQIDRERRILLMDSADLPEAEAIRAEGSTPPRVSDVSTARNPRGDREIVVDRPRGSDDVVIHDSASGSSDMSAAPQDAERRRAERRRIERMSTEF